MTTETSKSREYDPEDTAYKRPPEVGKPGAKEDAVSLVSLTLLLGPETAIEHRVILVFGSQA